MKALILGRPSRERADVVEALEGVGTQVDRCHESSWGCPGLDDACPLDGRDVDVAVAVADPSGGFEAQGIVCAHRARIPIVAVGASFDDPVLRYVSAELPFGADVVDGVERAASDVRGHAAAVEDALAEHLRNGERVEIVVQRRPGGIAVRLLTEVDTARGAALADRARDAIRTYDGQVDVIDVAVSLPVDDATNPTRNGGS